MSALVPKRWIINKRRSWQIVEKHARKLGEKTTQNARIGLLQDKSGRWSWHDLTREVAFGALIFVRLDFSLKFAHTKEVHPYHKEGARRLKQVGGTLESWWKGVAFPPPVKYSLLFSGQFVKWKLQSWVKKSLSPFFLICNVTFISYYFCILFTLYIFLLYFFNPFISFLFICPYVICNLGLWYIFYKILCL